MKSVFIEQQKFIESKKGIYKIPKVSYKFNVDIKTTYQDQVLEVLINADQYKRLVSNDLIIFTMHTKRLNPKVVTKIASRNPGVLQPCNRSTLETEAGPP